MKLVSIIIPIFNSAIFLRDCISSILKQDYNNFEILLIDDGSSDNSSQICQEYIELDSRIRYFRFENEGLSASRNRGLELAKGEFLMFIDSDDMLYSSSIMKLMKICIEREVDIVQGKTIRGKKIHPLQSKKELNVKIYSSAEALESMLFQSGWLSSVCGKLFKRTLFENIRFKPGILYEDLEISYRLLNECRQVAFIDQTVYFYRDTLGSIINTWNDKRLDVLQVTFEIEEYVKKFYPYILAAANDRRLSANFNMFILTATKGRKDVSDECWKVIKNYRNKSLKNPKVRLKNKVGIIISYSGKRCFTLLSRLFYRI